MKNRLWNGSPSLKISWVAAVVFFAVCVYLPLVFVFSTPRSADFRAVFGSMVYGRTIINTVIECVCSTVLSVFVGYVYAYAVVRLKIPGKKIFAAIPVVHMVTPPFVGGLAFILLLGRQGFITKSLLHLDVSLYGFPGLLIAQVLCFFPIAYLICAQNLNSINPELENAARAMGASRWKVFWTVTFPLSWPGIASSLLFVAVSVLSDFGNPMIVGGRFRVLAVEIYSQLTGWINGGKSAVLGLLLLVPSLVLFVFYNRSLKKHGVKTATVGTKNSGMEVLKGSPWVKILLTIFVAFFALCVMSQFIALVAGSFQTLWGVNTKPTFSHFSAVFKYGRELRNSLVFAGISALACTCVASLVSFLVNRTTCPLKTYLDSASQLPSAVPGSLLGFAFALVANRLNFHHSEILICLSMVVMFFPFSYRIMTSTFTQIRTSLDDGAVSLGASKFQAFWTVLMPVSSQGLFYSFIYSFVRGVGTLSAVIFLVSFNTPLCSIKILNLAEQGNWGKSAALSLLLTIITFGVLGLARLVSRCFEKRTGVHLAGGY